MIAHVAEAGEDRGRVVVRLDPAQRPSPAALAAAVHVAQAFNSEIESLVVADRQLYELASYPFAREISRSGRRQALSIGSLDRDIAIAAGVLVRAVRSAAAAGGVTVHERMMSDEPTSAVARTCAALGPWNVVALAEPFSGRAPGVLRRLFDAVLGATGIVVAGPRARDTNGPVVVAVESLDHLLPMLRAAERLAAVTRAEVRVLFVNENARALAWMESQARLLPTAPLASARIEPSEPVRTTEELAGRLARLDGGFLVARFGGLVVSEEADAHPLVSVLRCPLFLVR